MRIFAYVMVAAGIGGAALAASSSWASPLSSRSALSDLILPEIGSSMVQKVHGWHCRNRKAGITAKSAGIGTPGPAGRTEFLIPIIPTSRISTAAQEGAKFTL
jgi:hypothetical protein